MAKAKAEVANYGIAEWYGVLYRSLSNDARHSYLTPPEVPDCRFFADAPELAPGGRTTCNKKGGVCSIRNFVQSGDHASSDFGPITATCPNRFLEGKRIVETIGKKVLGTEVPLVAKEIPFLQRISIGEDGPVVETSGREDVGRIDLVLVHPDPQRFDWCAVELQAVYFSGAAMSKDYAAIRKASSDNIPMPGGKRRPDFRSSGPKRLMPQLQIKVPTLRRWGKKMVVVVDLPFFLSLGPMDEVSDVSNADIVWVVVDFEEEESSNTASLKVDRTCMVTLERAVEGLTAGIPTTKSEFEAKVLAKIGRDDSPSLI